MPDPKMAAFARYLLNNYRTATLPPDPAEMPPMTSDQLRVDRFVRSAPAHLPPPTNPQMARQLALAAAIRGRAGGVGRAESHETLSLNY